MENNKKNKFKVFMVLFVLLVLIAGSSYAVWRYNYNGTSNNTISSTDLSFRFLESNKEIVSIDNAVPMSDEDGIKQEGTGNVFDFEVKSKVGATTDVKYIASLEKISVDSGKTALNDSDVKVYIEDFNGNTVLKPTKISELNSYKLFEKLHRHSKDNSEISTKYKLKVWLDSEVDVFSLENKQYKFKINVKTEQKEQDRNQSYKLVYDLDGGTGSIADSTFKVGDKVTITSVVPTKEGYNFLGWSTKKNASSASYKAGDSVTLNDAYDGSVRLYAVWEQNITYTVKYNPNGGIIPATFTSSGTYPWEEINGVYRSGNYNVNSSSGTMKSDEFTLTESSNISFDWAVSSEGGSFDYLYYTIYKDGTALSGTGTSTKIGGYSSSDTENNLTYKTVTKTLEAGTYYIEFTYRKDSSGNKGLDRGYVKNLIISGYGEDKTMKDSTFGSGINKLSKNIYAKPHYIFKGWSLSKDATSATYQDEQEVDSLTKKDNDIVNLYAVWEANKYTVNVVVQNGTVDTAEKQIEYNKNGIFNLTTNVDGAIGSVTCTNNQKGKVENNILTVLNVNADTTCTVSFKDTFTTLYEDGTLIINESAKNRNTNLSAHGDITKEYEPMSDSNSYVMKSVSSQPWKNEKSSIKSVEIGQKIKPISTAYWLCYLSNMEKGDFTNLDTSSVADMSYMFYYASESVTAFNLDLSGWDVSKVTDMSHMFQDAGSKATTWSIGDLSKWNVSSVTNMSSMFSSVGQKATAWTIGDLSNWNVSNVTDMSAMFSSTGVCSTVWDIGNLSNWDTAKATRMYQMFYNAGQKATTWTIGDLSNWDTSKVTDMGYMFDYAGINATTFELKGLENWNVSNVTNMGNMFSSAGERSTTFNLNLSGWDVSKVTNMSYMFYNAGQKATTWTIGDFSKWNTSSVTNMSHMFQNAGSNTTTFELKGLKNWNMSSVTDMRSMFSSVGSNATTFNLDLSGWDVLKVTNMSYMFSSTGINATIFELKGLENWNTSSVTNMSNMFQNAGSKATTWTIGDLSNWNTSSVTDMRSMFQNVGSKATTWSIGDLSKWNVSSVTDMSSMFSSVGSNATTFNLYLSKWDTSNVTDMSYMFSSIGKNATTFNLDLSKWDTSNVTDMSYMFFGSASNATTWSVKIPSKTRELTNTTSKWYGFSDSVYAEPPWEKSFTIPNNVSVVVQDGVLGDGEVATKTGWAGQNVTFNIAPNDSSKSGFVSCTNNQTGTFKNDVLTVSNITSDTTCTVTFDFTSTVLYSDGSSYTLVINDLNSNIVEHESTYGGIVKQCESLNDSNSYVFNSESDTPWYDYNYQITNIFIGSNVSPISTSLWFLGTSYLINADFTNLDTSNVETMAGMFYGVGVESTELNLIGLNKWDTSNVTDMSYMFNSAGIGGKTLKLNLSNWNTSKVTNMIEMFHGDGYENFEVIIPRRTGSLSNTESEFYGVDDTVYANPANGFNFTLAN